MNDEIQAMMPGQSGVIEWKEAEDNNIEVVLLDDDFSAAIDGSGYVLDMPLSMTPTEA